MGMMGQMPPQQDVQDPNQASRFNGTIQSDEGPIQVVNGIAKVGGDVFFVSDDGKLAVDKNQNVVGVIINNKVQQITPEIEDQLRQSGLVK